jgi:hypothetical protein
MDALIPYQYAEDRLLGNSDRVAAIEWARDLMISSNFVVFDSETTGLSSPIDFVEIALVDPAGETLFDSLLKPSCRIEPRARAVHGHSAKSLSNAPHFLEVYPDLLDVLYKRRVIVFNASYDRRVWDTSVRHLGARGLWPVSSQSGSARCASLLGSLGSLPSEAEDTAPRSYLEGIIRPWVMLLPPCT